MHTVIHLGLSVGFLAVIAILFTIFVMTRPGAVRPVSRKRLLGIAVVGLVVGLVFLSTSSLYAMPS